jgi:hypothetical protein
MFRMLVQGCVPKVNDEDAPQRLSETQLALVLSALARMRIADVRARLVPKDAVAPDPRESTVTVEVLGVIGTASDMAHLAVMLPRDDAQAFTGDARNVLCAAYAGILRREPRAYERIESLFSGLEEQAAEELLKALADVGDARALRVFYEAARTRPSSSRTPVALLPKLAPSHDHKLKLEFAGWLRDRMDPSRPEWTRAVFTALGALDEGAALPELIESLDSESLPVRESALTALQKITGLAFGPERKRWETWYEAELKWFDRHRIPRQVRARPASTKDLIETLRAYSQHRLFKSELALDLVPLLEHKDTSVRVLTCETLAGIGSLAPVRELITLLDDPLPAVSGAARRALQALTGQAVTTDAAAAREAILRET